MHIWYFFLWFPRNGDKEEETEVEFPLHIIDLMTTPHTRLYVSIVVLQSGNKSCKTWLWNFSSQLSHQCLAKGKVSVLDNGEISQGTWFQKCKVCSHNLSQLQGYFEIIQTYRTVTRTVWELLYNLYPDLPFFTFCQLCTLSSLHRFVYIYIHTYYFLWTKLADTTLLHSYFLQLIFLKDKGILLISVQCSC